MKHFLFTFVFTLLANTAWAVNKNDTTVVSTSPKMSCANCEKKIKSNIRFVKGTKKIETSVPNQTVTIIYDGNKNTYEDYVTAFKKIGYDIQIQKNASKKTTPKK